MSRNRCPLELLIEGLALRRSAKPIDGMTGKALKGGSVSRQRIVAENYTVVGLTHRDEHDVVTGHRYHIRFSDYCLTIEEIVFDNSRHSSFRVRRGDDHTLTLAALL